MTTPSEPGLPPEILERRTRAKAAAADSVEVTETAAEAEEAVAEPSQSVDPAEEDDEEGPPRRGWWQRTFGA